MKKGRSIALTAFFCLCVSLLLIYSSLLLARLPEVRRPPGSRGLRREPGRRDLDLLEGRRERERCGGGAGGRQRRRGGAAAAPGPGLCHAPVGAVKVLVEMTLVEIRAPLLVGRQQAAVAGAEDGLRVGWRLFFEREGQRRGREEVLRAPPDR